MLFIFIYLLRQFQIIEIVLCFQNLPTATERHAEMALLAGDLSMAEGILLQSSLIKEAIHINIQIYNWNRYVRKLSET